MLTASKGNAKCKGVRGKGKVVKNGQEASVLRMPRLREVARLQR